MSQLTIAALKAQRLATIYPNGLNKINGLDHAFFEDNMIDSHLNLQDQYYLLGLRSWISTRAYKSDECCVYGDIIYQNQGALGLINVIPTSNPQWVPLTFVDNGLTEFAPYDNATTYVLNNTVRLGDKLYRCNNGPTQGNPPPDLAYWDEVSPALGGAIPQWAPASFYKDGKLVRFENNIYRCNQGGGLFTGVSFLTELAADLWRVFPEPVSISKADLLTRMGAGEVAFNQWYFISDENIWLKGTSPFTVSIDGLMKTPIPNAGASPDYAGIWEATPTTYATNKIVFWLSKLYLHITSTNTATNPRTDTTNWQLIPTGDATKYRYEIDAIEYDINSYGLLTWKDKRGNVLMRNANDADWWYKFLKGIDGFILNETHGNSTLFTCHGGQSAGGISGLKLFGSNFEIKNCFGGTAFANTYFFNSDVKWDRTIAGSLVNYRVNLNNSGTFAQYIISDSDVLPILTKVIDGPKILSFAAIDITGLSTIDFTGLNAKHVDIIILTSTNPSEIITDITNGWDDKRYLFKAGGIGVTFSSGASIPCKGGVDIVLAAGDNCEFLIESGKAKEINRSNY